MKFKIDENLPLEIAEILRSYNYDAVTVKEQDLCGSKDRTIIDICVKEKRALITVDMDFSDIRSYPPSENYGIIVFRVHRQDKVYLMNIFKQVIPLLEIEPLQGHLWIIEVNRIRIR